MSDQLIGAPLEPARLAEVWTRLLLESGKSWVAFSNGTCVVLSEPASDLGEQARLLLSAEGPVRPSLPGGDFGVLTLRDAPGWVVTSHIRDIMTYVAPEDLGAKAPNDFWVGMIGRTKRGADAQSLTIVHVEDRRSSS